MVIGTLLLSYIKPFILPPGIHIFTLALSSILIFFKRTLGYLLLFISFTFFYFCTTPVFSNWLIYALETYPPLNPATLNSPSTAQAIVVLAGSQQNNAKEYNGENVSSETLVRLRYTARLARITKLPIIVSGGSPLDKFQTSEAELMKAVLVNDFGIDANLIWIEPNSENTMENAEFTKTILVNKGFKEIFCVTSANHMPRAIFSFAKVGIKAIAAPTGFLYHDQDKAANLAWLPSMHSYAKSRTAIHERIGLIWYKIRY